MSSSLVFPLFLTTLPYSTKLMGLATAVQQSFGQFVNSYSGHEFNQSARST